MDARRMQVPYIYWQYILIYSARDVMGSTDSFTPMRIFLLSVWQEKDLGKGKLRYHLEDPHTGEKHSFADLEQLEDFLQSRFYDQSTTKNYWK